MFRRACSAISSGIVLLAGCNHLPDTPALIVRPSPESNAELRAVLQRALGPRDIRIAADALTESSILTLEPGVERDSPARGRLLEAPERFELVQSGKRCYLVRSSTEERFALEHTECVPVRTGPAN
jgi:hypothetical protein